MQHSIAYLLRREEQEMDLAVHSQSLDARNIHLELARRYRILIDELTADKRQHNVVEMFPNPAASIARMRFLPIS